MKMKKGAFTLIELLVVIAIIALLMAILMPALRLAKDQAAALICLNNLNNLSLGWFTYTIDNDGELMGGHRVGNGNFKDKSCFPDGFWAEPPQDVPPARDYKGGEKPGLVENKLRGIRMGQLFSYVKNVKLYHCPFDARIDMPDQQAYCSYSVAGGMNGEEAYRPGGPCKVHPEKVAEVFDEIRAPANKIVFIEESDPRGWNIGSWIMNPTGNCWIDPLAGWHNERSTLGFADGHAEKHRWLSKNTVKMNVEQEGGYCTDTTPNDLDDDADLFYMQQGYVSGKNK
jgi:prepilin-type N-terminal cleavage/methylation domain-containing protein/prepilin-type processing-associated H-X9-DG protein